MKSYIVESGAKVNLSQWDPNDRSAFDGDKAEAEDRMQALGKRMGELQEVLYAEHKHKVLVVLQGMDTSGKDGTISHVFDAVNPQGVRVASFKAPTQPELEHDYLWRIHPHMPARGEIAIFNRSHYEDVLVVCVHNLVPPEVWRRRYAQINDFERMLAEEGTTIVKFFLNIDEKEQKERLQARLDDPSKHWKFNPGDLEERMLWPEYLKAYEAVLSQTSTAWAPWHVIPANRKWYRNLMVASTLVEALEALDMKYPEPKVDLRAVKIE